MSTSSSDSSYDKTTTEYIAALPQWITGKRYAELSGYSYEAIRKKCYHGVWPEGIIWKRAPDKRLIINWRAVDDWLSSMH